MVSITAATMLAALSRKGAHNSDRSHTKSRPARVIVLCDFRLTDRGRKQQRSCNRFMDFAQLPISPWMFAYATMFQALAGC